MDAQLSGSIRTDGWMDEVFGVHVRVVGAGLFSVALRFPAAVAVDQLGQVGRLLGVACDEFVF